MWSVSDQPISAHALLSDSKTAALVDLEGSIEWWCTPTFAGAFTQVLGGDALDASSLVIPMVGFLPFHDQRVQATVDAIREKLSDDRGLIYRYRSDDGLDGDEGAFLLCTFWLAEALAGAGRVSEAREVFDLAASYRNDVDLMAEEVERETGEMIGNFPQAFSHVGLINAAWAIKQAEERA